MNIKSLTPHAVVAAAITSAVAMLSLSASDVANAGTTATAVVEAAVGSGCDFPSSVYTITFPDLPSTSINSTGVTKLGTIQVNCSAGVTAKIQLADAQYFKWVDLDGDGTDDVSVFLVKEDCVTTNGYQYTWPLTVTGTGVTQDIPVCAVIQNNGQPVPSGTISVTFPLTYEIAP